MSKIQRPRTSHGQHRPRKRHQRFTFKHDFATILRQSAAFDTDLFRCHKDQTEKIRQPLGNSHVAEAIFDVGDTKPSCRHHIRIDLLTLRSLRSKGDSHLDMVGNASYSFRHQQCVLYFRPSSLRTAKRPTFSLGFKSESHHNSPSLQANQFETCAPAVQQHRVKIRLRSGRHHLSTMHRVVSPCDLAP